MLVVQTGSLPHIPPLLSTGNGRAGSAMTSIPKVILQPKPLLHGNKPSIDLRAYKPPTMSRDNRAPANVGIRNHGQRDARKASILSQLFMNKPTQIDARNALLRHLEFSPPKANFNTGEGFQGKRDLSSWSRSAMACGSTQHTCSTVRSLLLWRTTSGLLGQIGARRRHTASASPSRIQGGCVLETGRFRTSASRYSAC